MALMTDTTGPRDAAWDQEYRKRRDAYRLDMCAKGLAGFSGREVAGASTEVALDAHVLTEVARLREALEQIAAMTADHAHHTVQARSQDRPSRTPLRHYRLT